jgi:hypothetical protein
MNPEHWTPDHVRKYHGRNIFLWYKKEGKVCCRVCMLWVIYEAQETGKKAELCSLYDKGDSLKQANRLSAEEMAVYLQKFTATVPPSEGALHRDD